jgi:cytochrome bd ubiquinol oxidase subunit I
MSGCYHTGAVALAADLLAARQQMALSLGWHIVIACFGVGFPIFVLAAEARALRRDDPDARRLARRWSSALAVLFAVGAVSGTILSFELGILWPGLMGDFGDVWGLPFTIEGIAFFTEAIFLGLYLYGWERFSPRAHLLIGLPIPIAGVASAWFVVTANAWMNQPRGFDVEHYLATGEVRDVDPWAAMFNPATPVQTTHMILAAVMVAGFGTAAVYAAAWRKGRRDRYHRLGFLIPFAVAAVVAPIQIVVGDSAARFLADNQPIKLAAIEGLDETGSCAPLEIGGIYIDGEVRYGLRIPCGLSLLARHDPDATIQGLEEVPPEDRPPVNPVRIAFLLMVTAGFGLAGLGVWWGWRWWRSRRLPESRWFWLGAVVAGPAAVVALEAGWVVTEVGRQPWIVYEVMRVEDAVTEASNLWIGYVLLLITYTVLTVTTAVVLRRLARRPHEVAA